MRSKYHAGVPFQIEHAPVDGHTWLCAVWNGKTIMGYGTARSKQVAEASANLIVSALNDY